MRRNMYMFIGIAILWAFATPVSAAAPLNGRYLYHFSWNGLALGTMLIDIREDAEHYSLRSEVETTGLVKIFAKHTSHSKAFGLRNGRGYQPSYYESLYQTKKKKKHVTMTFDEDGMLLSESALPYDDGKDRTPIMKRQKDRTIDPLTALLAGRNIPLFMTQESDAISLYDGTRLFTAIMKPGDKKTIAIGKENVPVSHWIASRAPVGGYTQKDLAKMAKGEPPLNLYFAKDASLLPLRIELPLPLGTVTGFLVGECAAVACPAMPDWDTLEAEWQKALGN